MKGVSGKVLTLVITLVIVIVALIVMFVFYNKMIPFISKIVENIISGITREICMRMIGKIPLVGPLICG